MNFTKVKFKKWSRVFDWINVLDFEKRYRQIKTAY